MMRRLFLCALQAEAGVVARTICCETVVELRLALPLRSPLGGQRQRDSRVIITKRRCIAKPEVEKNGGIGRICCHRRTQKRIRPVSMSLNMTQSPRKLYSGYWKVAGRFFSNMKWPTQAKP